jgi:hypothetical protein
MIAALGAAEKSKGLCLCPRFVRHSTSGRSIKNPDGRNSSRPGRWVVRRAQPRTGSPTGPVFSPLALS